MSSDPHGDAGSDEPRASSVPGHEGPDWRLLVRCISGEAGASEDAELDRWVGSDDARMRLVEQVRAIWQKSGTPINSIDLDSALVKIKARAEPTAAWSPAVIDPATVDETASKRRRRLWQVVATTATGLAALLIFWMTSRKLETPAPSRTISAISTLRGERARIRLPDGSDVVLAPLTTLHYGSDYGLARRELVLRGKALFTVRHDSIHPFVVRTDHVTLSDIGTRFVVSAYPNTTATDVMVSDGAVAVGGTALLLQAGDVVTMMNDGRARVRHGATASEYLSWTDGRIVFKDTPLRDALAELSRWYDADLRLADDPSGTVAGAPLTATIQDESLAQVTELLRATFNLSSAQRTVGGRKVIIFKSSFKAHDLNGR